MNPNLVRTAADNRKRAETYVGQTVETTGGKRGTVTTAVPKKDGVIELRVVSASSQGDAFTTDSEHATIVRNR